MSHVEWAAAGVLPEQVVDWSWTTPKAAAKWIRAGFTGEVALRFAEYGLDPGQGPLWHARGFEPDEAVRWIGAGWSSADASVVVQQFGKRGFNPDVTFEWATRGFTAPQAEDWAYGGMFDPETAKVWAEAGIEPQVARAWLQEGLTTEEVKEAVECASSTRDRSTRG